MQLSHPYQAADERINGRWASELIAELPERLSTRVLELAERQPQQEAIVDGEVRWSYAELAEEVRSAVSVHSGT